MLHRRVSVAALAGLTALACICGNGSPSCRADAWISAGLTGMTVQALAIDARGPKVMYAGTDGDGVFRSEDDGGSWMPASNGLGNMNVHAVHVVAWNPGRQTNAGTDGGVFSTGDGGNSWAACNPGMPYQRVLTVKELWAGTKEGGLYWAGCGYWEYEALAGRDVRAVDEPQWTFGPHRWLPPMVASSDGETGKTGSPAASV